MTLIVPPSPEAAHEMVELKKLVKCAVREVMERPYGVAYTGVMVENQADRKRLKSVAAAQIYALGLDVSGWTFPDDLHMTICLGELPLSVKMRGDVDQDVDLHVTHFGFSDLAVAFRVTGYMSKNDTQHITMAFRVRPADSKEITEWHELEPFVVTGVIREVAAARP